MNKRPQPRDFGFGSDEQLLRDQARKFLGEHSTIDKVRKLVGEDHNSVYEKGELPGYDKALWAQCVELGWTAMAVPESAGGLGIKTVGVASLIEEVGRHCFPSPLVSTVCATYVLNHADSDAARGWLGKIAEGMTASLAITGAEGSWDLDACDVVAEADGDGLVLNGTACFVQDAAKADAFVVSARQGDGVALCVVPRDAVTVTQDHIVDLTRDQGSVKLDGVKVAADAIAATAADGLTALSKAWPSVLTMISADLTGCAEWQLQTTVEYAQVRKQFDRPLGFFQAVKHPLVNAMIAIDQARSHTYNAACAIDTEPDAADQFARMAKSAASDAGAFVSSRSVQLHGGIGFTWECDVHLYFKRSMHNQTLYGDGVHQRRKLADMLMGPIPA